MHSHTKDTYYSCISLVASFRGNIEEDNEKANGVVDRDTQTLLLVAHFLAVTLPHLKLKTRQLFKLSNLCLESNERSNDDDSRTMRMNEDERLLVLEEIIN